MLGILGTTALLMDGEADDQWGRPRERAVLATLAVHAGKVVQLDTLIRWAWPTDKPIPQNPATTFHTYAARIRRALRRLPVPADVRAGQGGYQLQIDPALIDRNMFRTLVTEGRTHAAANRHEQAIEIIEQALALSRGTPVADLTSAAGAAWRAGFIENDLLAAHTTLIEQLLALSRFEDALVRLDDLHGDYPDDVTLASLRLTALYGGMRKTHATAFYLAAWRRLRDSGDDEGAEHLRQHNNSLRLEHGVVTAPVPVAAPQLLPPDRTHFVGRAELLARLNELVDHEPGEPPTGIVVLAGMGGVGKTTLALHWAGKHRHLFPGGNLFFNMHGYADRARVEHTTVVDDFLVALGHPPDNTLSPRRREQLLSALLSDQKTLVLLDNVRDTGHIRDLVPLLSNCFVLVTSRQLLTSLRTEAGAELVTVRPMTGQEGAELLTRQLGPGTQLDEERIGHLALLCGGLPLLITVLAGDLANRPAAGIAEYSSMIDRTRLVAGFGDHGDGPTSGATCFAPSYRALAPAERRLFRLLTVHPGPEIGLAVACACDGRPAQETTLSLSKLVGAHLIEEIEPVHRYRFHDVLSAYATQCREEDEPPDEQAAAVHRVLDYYVDTTTRACGAVLRSYTPPPVHGDPGIAATTFDDADSARRWFMRERTNLTAAITFASEHEHHEHAWRLADPVTTFFDRLGNHLDSRALRETALRSARAAGDRVAEASALSCLGMTHMMLGDHTEARRCFEGALRLVDEDGPDRGRSSILHQLGRVALRQGDPVEALSLFRRGMTIDQEIGNREGLCWAHCRIGEALHAVDQHEQALAQLNRAALIAQEIGEASAESQSLGKIGAIHRELGNLAMAAGHCEQALAIAESIPDRTATAGILVDLCEISRARRRSRQAIAYGRRAARLCETTHDLEHHARALEALGNAQYDSGDLVDATVAWGHAADMYDELGNTANAGHLRRRISNVPTFYREVVPIARTSPEAANTPSWPGSDETTQPLGRIGEIDSTEGKYR